MHINASFNAMENEAAALAGFAAALRGCERAVNGTAAQLSLLNMGNYHPNPALRKAMQEILDNAAKMDTFSKALSEIVRSYRTVEGALLSQSSAQEERSDDENGFGEAIQRIIASFRDTLRDIMLALGIVKAEKQTRVEGEPVSVRQEHEMDLYLQNEISEMRKESRFSESTWRQASLNERKEILQEYINRIASLMGLPVGAINWIYREPSHSGGHMYYTMGSYSSSTDRISINTWVLENGDSNNIDTYDLMRTLAHEMRHYYQQEAVRHPDQYVVTEETIQAWQKSIVNYKTQGEFQAEGMTDAEAFQAYRNQEIERDARRFAGQD